MPVLLTIIGISLLIFIHEFGHFLCARLAGVKVHIFSLGFGPRLWGFRRGDTDYRISAMPLGGYVHVAGQDPTIPREHLGPTDLNAKGFLARGFFYSGGVLMNLLFALVAFPLVFNSGVDFDAPVLGSVRHGSPAWEAGLQRGDRILSVNDKEMYSFNNLIVEVALANPRRGVVIHYERADQSHECTVFPRYEKRPGLRTIGVDRAAEDGPFPVDVPPDTPSYLAGLRSKDVLLTFNGTPVESLEDWEKVNEDYAKARENGETRIALEVRRAGEVKRFEFEPKAHKKDAPRLGVVQASRRVEGLRQGVPALEALGLRRDDRILFVDGKPFHGPRLDFGKTSGKLTLAVARKGREPALTLTADVSADRRKALADAIAFGPDDAELTIRLQPDSPALRAGMQTGDRITAIDGKPIKTWPELVNAVHKAKDKTLRIAVVRASGFVQIEVKLERQVRYRFVPTLKWLRTKFKTESFGTALTAGWVASWDFVKQIYVTLKRLFTGEVSPTNLGGIITISRVSYAYAQDGLARLFYFLAILSINLAVINVLPIPVFDGGHLLFLLIERIKGSPISTKVHNYSQILGLVFILLLLVYVTYNDILKLRWFS